MMLGGGILYAFDISSLDDMRRSVRASIGVDGPRTDEDVEKEIEEWIASVLNRGSKTDTEEKRSKGSDEKGSNATILEMISKLEESRGKGLDKEGIATILDKLSKLEGEKRGKGPNDQDGKS